MAADQNDPLTPAEVAVLFRNVGTDTVRSEAEVDAKLAAYELQGAAYALALESATGLTVIDCRFVFCRPSGAIERRIADLDAAKDRVRRHLEAVCDHRV